MREWSVASAILDGPAGVLLVANRRRDGRIDWSPPGGVVDAGETVRGALDREVHEETGLRVGQWSGQLYAIEVDFVDLGWNLRVEVHQVASWSGELRLDDPDGIVVDARWSDPLACRDLLDASPRWVSEPVCDWLADPWTDLREYAYRVAGSSQSAMSVERR